ncbi:hypothetical protein LTR37_018531 [Vermiconidia calcicola]|uniref:Uncharacterized protein n=1 Tax=Vermiconidia calcicola TaxID=1690605 RepID=A0ACC3MGS6_9PEZI|nr:hypothetical protein LTR37_018531 [Vermiconidia calcicola]
MYHNEIQSRTLVNDIKLTKVLALPSQEVEGLLLPIETKDSPWEHHRTTRRTLGLQVMKELSDLVISKQPGMGKIMTFSEYVKGTLERGLHSSNLSGMKSTYFIMFELHVDGLWADAARTFLTSSMVV